MRGIALRAGLVSVAVVGMAASAGAFQLAIVSWGTYTGTMPNVSYLAPAGLGGLFIDGSIRNLGDPGYLNPANQFHSVTANLVLTPATNGTGAFTLYNTANPILATSTLSGVFSNITTINYGFTTSYAGNVQVTGGTGVYTGFTGPGTGSGTILTFQFTPGHNTAQGELTITATPVPEPYTLILGATALVLGIHRRRARKI